MTDNPSTRKNDPQQQRADINRARMMQSRQRWSKLLSAAVDPGFTGKIAMELPVIEGRLGQLATVITQRPAD